MKRVVAALLLPFALAPWAVAQEKPGPKLPEGTKVLRDLEYVKGGHERQKLDLYLPKADGPLPLVVWVHGGAWRTGSKDGGGPALPLLARGYAVASINYRLSQHAAFPAQIHDCKAAVRWLRANAKEHRLDPDRIGVWGGSAGGHLVALLGTTAGHKGLEGDLGYTDQPSRVQCVIDFFGPADFTSMPAQLAQNATGPVAQLVGGPVSENKEKAALASPVTHVTRDAAPFLIVHGDKDATVPLAQSEKLAEVLKKAGAEVTLVTLEGAAHGGAPFTNPENRKKYDEFLDKHLKGAKK